MCLEKTRLRWNWSLFPGYVPGDSVSNHFRFDIRKLFDDFLVMFEIVSECVRIPFHQDLGCLFDVGGFNCHIVYFGVKAKKGSNRLTGGCDTTRRVQAAGVRRPWHPMGNPDLRQLAVIEPIEFDALGGSVVAVDAHNWLYRYLTTTVRFTNAAVYTTAAGDEVANLIGVVQGLPKFFEHDMTPIFVFDGGVIELKSDEIETRREAKESYEAQLADAKERGDAIEISTLESRTQRLTETILSTTVELLRILDVPIVEAPAEGEAQAAHMARNGEVDYVGSEDYDSLLLGTPQTLRQLTSKGNPELMDLHATLEKHDLTWEQLVDVGILMGTDFNQGLSGVGPKTAVSLIQEHGDLWAVLDDRSEYIENVDRIRELFLNPAVTDDYDLSLDIDPDLEQAKTYVCDEWEVPFDEVARGFERIEASVVQTGLDRWT